MIREESKGEESVNASFDLARQQDEEDESRVQLETEKILSSKSVSQSSEQVEARLEPIL